MPFWHEWFFELRDLFKENSYVEMDYPTGMRTRTGSLRYRKNVGYRKHIRFVSNLTEFVVGCIRQLWHVQFRQFLDQQPERYFR